MVKDMSKRYNKYKSNIIKKKNYNDHIKEISTYLHDREFGINSTLELLKNNNLNFKIVNQYMEMHQLTNVVDKVKNKINEQYQAGLGGIQLVQYHSIGKLTATTSSDTVFIDGLLEGSLHEFFVLTLIWAKHFEDKEKYGRFFNYLFGLCYQLCEEEKSTSNIYAFQYVKEEAERQEAIFNVAVGCETFVLYFCIAHEIAHQYFTNKGKVFKKYQKEFEADSIAYDITLRLMVDEMESRLEVENQELFEYAYLAPVMLMHFWELIFYTDRVLNKTYIIDDDKHPHLKKRIANLFSIPYDDKYVFETEKGNAVYNGFLNVIDSYKQQLLVQKHTGEIDKLIKHIRREEI